MKHLVLIAAVVACGGRAQPAPAAGPDIARSGFKVTSEPGIAIAVREVSRGDASRSPVLLVHGAGLGAMSFDLPVPGYSLAEDVARAGHPTYLLDIRGWGESSRPPALGQDPDGQPPAVSSVEAVRDIAAVVAEIRRRHRDRGVALVGWAMGGYWAGMYAASHPKEVDRLVMLNSLYNTRAPWTLNSTLEDRPGHFSAEIGAYSLRDGKSLIGRWMSSIPGDDKDNWRDPRVADAYVAAAMASDPTANDREPPTVRVPSGPLRDGHAAAAGEMLWHASSITAPVLVVRGALDYWSRPEDLAALQRDLRSRDPRFVTIPDATHMLFLDRPEHGRATFVELLLAFLAAN